MSAWNEFTPGPQPSVTCVKLTFRISTAPSPTSPQIPFCTTGITAEAAPEGERVGEGVARERGHLDRPRRDVHLGDEAPDRLAVRHLPGFARVLAPARTERRHEHEPGEARPDRV